MSLCDRIANLPLEIKYKILLNLDYESVDFIQDDYFWRNYCLSRGIGKDAGGHISWKYLVQIEERHKRTVEDLTEKIREQDLDIRLLKLISTRF